MMTTTFSAGRDAAAAGEAARREPEESARRERRALASWILNALEAGQIGYANALWQRLLKTA